MGVEEDLQDYRKKHHKAYLERKRRELLATGATIGPPALSPPPEPILPTRTAPTFAPSTVLNRARVSPTGTPAQPYKYTPPATLHPSISQDNELARRLQEEEDAKLARTLAETGSHRQDLDGVRAPDHSYRENLLGETAATLTHTLLGHPVEGRDESGRSPPPLPPSRVTQYAPVVNRAYGPAAPRPSAVVRPLYGADERGGFSNGQTRVVEGLRHQYTPPERSSNAQHMQPSPLSPANRQTSPLHPRTYFKSSSPPSGSEGGLLTPSPIASDLEMSEDDQMRRAMALSKKEHEASIKDRKY